MYSFAPLPAPDMGHGGFYFVVAILLAVYIMILVQMEDWRIGIVSLLIATGIGGCTYNESYNRPYKYPKNEQVVGKFIGYETEGYSERSGKSTVDKHIVYVIYEVPEGRVLMHGSTGMVYPKLAILYKN